MPDDIGWVHKRRQERKRQKITNWKEEAEVLQGLYDKAETERSKLSLENATLKAKNEQLKDEIVILQEAVSSFEAEEYDRQINL